jgi:putative addiction module component (TIGR02574 family)
VDNRLLEQVQKLSVNERLELIEVLWDSIVESNAVPPLTDAQKAELDRRIADHEGNPDDVVSWEEAKASALSRVRR